MNFTDEMIHHAETNGRDSLEKLFAGLGPKSSERLVRSCIEAASEIALRHGVRVPFEELLSLDAIRTTALNAATDFDNSRAVAQAERVLPRVAHALQSTEEEAELDATEPTGLSGQARINWARANGRS